MNNHYYALIQLYTWDITFFRKGPTDISLNNVHSNYISYGFYILKGNVVSSAPLTYAPTLVNKYHY